MSSVFCKDHKLHSIKTKLKIFIAYQVNILYNKKVYFLFFNPTHLTFYCKQENYIFSWYSIKTCINSSTYFQLLTLSQLELTQPQSKITTCLQFFFFIFYYKQFSRKYRYCVTDLSLHEKYRAKSTHIIIFVLLLFVLLGMALKTEKSSYFSDIGKWCTLYFI